MQDPNLYADDYEVWLMRFVMDPEANLSKATDNNFRFFKLSVRNDDLNTVRRLMQYKPIAKAVKTTSLVTDIRDGMGKKNQQTNKTLSFLMGFSSHQKGGGYRYLLSIIRNLK